jgi:hypothetical protein
MAGIEERSPSGEDQMSTVPLPSFRYRPQVKIFYLFILAGEPTLLRVNEIYVRMRWSLPVEMELCCVSEG